jgi:hypothetical protein
MLYFHLSNYNTNIYCFGDSNLLRLQVENLLSWTLSIRIFPFSGVKGLALTTGLNLVGFCLMKKTESSLRNAVFKLQNRPMDKVKKNQQLYYYNIVTNFYTLFPTINLA